MENKKNISYEEWEENYKECMELHQSGSPVFENRQTKGGFSGTYMAWYHIWAWIKKKYPDFKYLVTEIDKTSYIKGELWINGILQGSTVLNLEQFQTHAETPEQLVNRVFVKLVAQYTGYGFHLWYLGKQIQNTKKTIKTYNKEQQWKK